MKKIHVITLTMLLCLGLSAPLSAHNLWLNATDFAPTLSGRAGAHSKIYFGFGHRFPVQDFLDKEKLREFRLTFPDGSQHDLDAEENGFLATPVVFKKAGGYIVSAATQTGFYTMFSDGDGRMHHKMAGMQGLSNVVLSLYYENYTKALIDVESSNEQAYATPVGHRIEIVPLENPYLKKAGDTLRLQVLFNGKPAPFCPLSATYLGFSSKDEYAFSTKTNSRGIAELRLLQPSQWIVLATLRKPADSDHQGQCLELKYTASLSFSLR
ncbi:DUF4198 domain-containing protein [uncultured Desulfuromonas sp.]|uniref:DUF4198 domain-containing protein n=1 Tax=uncultured Desulfuromonas sp. TaxID=181013 RepID=UPI002AAB46CE|nr:DUF4198 domain-containing protein [uncultured Desulfuromonas sp.]